jgi:hypothetical protein
MRRPELNKLNFIVPTLSVHNDNLLNMMAKDDERDDTDWISIIDMGRAVVEALLPVSTKSSYTIKMYCLRAFPSYYPADGTVKRQMMIVTTATLCKVTCFVTIGAFSNSSGDER